MADDSQVIELSLSDPEQFASVFDRHADEIYRYAARRVGPDAAGDVVSETFLAAFRKRAAYDLSRPDARPWLYGIASRLIAQERRVERRHLELLARGRTEGEAFEDGAADRVTAQGLRPELSRALARLRVADRNLLLLIAWAGLSYDEAAQALGIPVGTVRSRLHRLKRRLRPAFGDINPLREA